MTDARARIHAMLQLSEQGEAELDRRLDALAAESLHSFLHHLEYSAGDSAAEKLLEDAPELAALLAGEKATAPTAKATPDARQAARIEAADWFASYPFNAETTDWARGRGDAIAWVIGILRNPNPRMPGPDATEAGDGS